MFQLSSLAFLTSVRPVGDWSAVSRSRLAPSHVHPLSNPISNKNPRFFFAQRHIFEKFSFARAKANFDSNSRKSWPGSNWRGPARLMARVSHSGLERSAHGSSHNPPQPLHLDADGPSGFSEIGELAAKTVPKPWRWIYMVHQSGESSRVLSCVRSQVLLWLLLSEFAYAKKVVNSLRLV